MVSAHHLSAILAISVAAHSRAQEEWTEMYSQHSGTKLSDAEFSQQLSSHLSNPTDFEREILARLNERAEGSMHSRPRAFLESLVGKGSNDEKKPICGISPLKPPLTMYDMHDRDTKTVAVASGKLVITPGDGTGSWSTSAVIDKDQCTALVDFNVPNKPNPPSVNITASIWGLRGGNGGMKNGIFFNDLTGTLGPASKILNAWLPEIDTSATDSDCGFQSGTAVFNDMADGDQKQIQLVEAGDDTRITITPYGNDQSWTTTATFDKGTCSALVDFNVPGKPSPPPTTITATLYKASDGADHRLVVVFSDLTGTIASKSKPLNAWIQA